MVVRGKKIESYNLVFNINDENNSFSVLALDKWEEGTRETIDQFREILEHRSQNDIQLHSQELEKIGYYVDLGDDDNSNDKGRYQTIAFFMEEYKNGA